MAEHPYGWLSLVPPIAAILLAIATRRIVVSLLAGIVIGALITAQGNPLRAIEDTIVIHLWTTIADWGRLQLFAFTLAMGAMVGVINRSGGMRGLIGLVTPWAKTRCQGQLATWFLGLLIFFDDYANSVLLGNTLRPLCDQLKISREKLAYLVDSTAAPVAGLALLSTWIAVEIGYVQDGISNLPAAAAIDQLPTAFDLLVASIPYRFYVLWALLFVPLVGLLGRDFGPMLRAERRALSGEDSIDPNTPTEPYDPTAPSASTPGRWYNAVVPISACVAAIVVTLYVTGRNELLESDATAELSLQNILGVANSYAALLCGSGTGLFLAAFLAGTQRLLDMKSLLQAAWAGARLMVPALLILWTASSLSRMTGNKPIPGFTSQTVDAAEAGTKSSGAAATESYRLFTGDYLSSLVGHWIPAWMLPTAIFALASLVALATGTSYGTMGILLPIAIPLSYATLFSEAEPFDPHHPVFLASIGSVLAGAIFGDHCSPISDTTVLSSQASGCDHVAHVWTQLPYAMLVGAISIGVGTIPVGFGFNVWILLPVGVGVMVVALGTLGRRP